MKKIGFRIRGRTGYKELPISIVNELVNPYEQSDEEFLQEILELHETAKDTQTVQEFGGGGILDLFVFPNGILYLGHRVICLDLVVQEIPNHS